MTAALDRLIAMLASRPATGGAVFNPWRDWDPALDATAAAPMIRRAHLRAYLAARLGRAETVIFAEAPGYQGARFSGIAMTCERTLLGHKAVVPADAVFVGAKHRTSLPAAGRNQGECHRGFCEPTATIVWSALIKADYSDRAVLWNIFPYHPHKPGQPLTNRTPTAAEVTAELDVARAILSLFPGCGIVAVGETAAQHLAQQIGCSATKLRHPANGGATAFRDGFSRFLDSRNS